MKVAIFASGAGSNALNLIQYSKNHKSIEIVCILTNNANAGVLKHGEQSNIDTLIFSKSEFLESHKIIEYLANREVELIVLAGFLWLIPEALIRKFTNRIINIHPSLLPKFGGRGMYGHHVHEAVEAAQESESGITVHLVNEHYDEGAILFQAKENIQGLKANEIEQKVRSLELAHYPTVVHNYIQKLNK
ncbi:MAG: formyltransferase family protein [Bacteroidota bacterium]|jgi:phosphoribosylglycinamide formyltransferase-1